MFEHVFFFDVNSCLYLWKVAQAALILLLISNVSCWWNEICGQRRKGTRLQRHCEEEDDEEAMAEKEKERIMKFNAKGDCDFTEHRSIAEITMDSLLRTRGRLAEEKVSGSEDSVVAKMTKQLPKEKKVTK